MSKEDYYYEARGFSTYYLCNAVFNIIGDTFSYLRGIEEILGDMKTEFFMRPFKKYTNLHEFIRCVSEQVITEEVDKDHDSTRFLEKFLETYKVPFPANALDDKDSFYNFRAESERYHEALDEITDEVFHILFNDIGFLQSFNQLCSFYISNAAPFGAEHLTRQGTLKRTSIPVWARRAVFHRDKGECRNCKRSLASIINQLDRECYDHIVPLALHGANDVTNLQLLCEPCNLAKLAKDVPASRLYQRAIKP